LRTQLALWCTARIEDQDTVGQFLGGGLQQCDQVVAAAVPRRSLV
jgi:hypothetical protein